MISQVTALSVLFLLALFLSFTLQALLLLLWLLCRTSLSPALSLLYTQKLALCSCTRLQDTCQPSITTIQTPCACCPPRFAPFPSATTATTSITSRRVIITNNHPHLLRTDSSSSTRHRQQKITQGQLDDLFSSSTATAVTDSILNSSAI